MLWRFIWYSFKSQAWDNHVNVRKHARNVHVKCYDVEKMYVHMDWSENEFSDF